MNQELYLAKFKIKMLILMLVGCIIFVISYSHPNIFIINLLLTLMGIFIILLSGSMFLFSD